MKTQTFETTSSLGNSDVRIQLDLITDSVAVKMLLSDLAELDSLGIQPSKAVILALLGKKVDFVPTKKRDWPSTFDLGNNQVEANVLNVFVSQEDANRLQEVWSQTSLAGPLAGLLIKTRAESR